MTKVKQGWLFFTMHSFTWISFTSNINMLFFLLQFKNNYIQLIWEWKYHHFNWNTNELNLNKFTPAYNYEILTFPVQMIWLVWWHGSVCRDLITSFRQGNPITIVIAACKTCTLLNHSIPVKKTLVNVAVWFT